ncbi:hypothetical protein N665_0405s0008 [Sinapis alba]|nr:hypothetical protein N665_0405s0008 [Sinapis alba]
MNCKIGFLSFVMFSSIIILFLTVQGKVEAAELHCLEDPCTFLVDCPADCTRSGYKTGQCVPTKKDPAVRLCCCDI